MTLAAINHLLVRCGLPSYSSPVWAWLIPSHWCRAAFFLHDTGVATSSTDSHSPPALVPLSPFFSLGPIYSSSILFLLTFILFLSLVANLQFLGYEQLDPAQSKQPIIPARCRPLCDVGNKPEAPSLRNQQPLPACCHHNLLPCPRQHCLGPSPSFCRPPHSHFTVSGTMKYGEQLERESAPQWSFRKRQSTLAIHQPNAPDALSLKLHSNSNQQCRQSRLQLLEA